MKRFLFLFLFFPFSAQAGVWVICPGYEISAKRRIVFGPNEKILICGDDAVPSWSEIPLNQAEYHIRVFLQDRGYFYPEFKTGNGKVIVEAGTQTQVKEVLITGSAPGFFKFKKKRNVVGKVLTPTLLSETENWTEAELESHGYPCPEVTALARPKEGEITLHIETGPLQNLVSIEEEPVPGLLPGVLRRYDAFKLGKPYDARLLAVTEERVETDGLLQNTYFITSCGADGATAVQHVIPGKPRLVMVGFGANSEEYAIAKASWKSGRMGAKGSNVQFSVFGSLKRQEFFAEAKWYVLKKPSRWHFNPLASFRREDEDEYEFMAGDIRLTPAFTWDNQRVGIIGRLGPKLNYTQTYEGAREALTHFLGGTLELEVMSHEFEFYRPEPQTGFSIAFLGDFYHEFLYSDATVQRMRIIGQSLWNIGGYDPPWLVLGVRGGLGTTLTDPDDEAFAFLPPDFRYFLGGSLDLRGFGRKELPESNDGALTMAWLGIELRSTKVLPFNIQPLVFTDFGVTGDTAFDFDAPLYFSPGVGLRWPSPIGIFRGTVSHGFLAGGRSPKNEDLTHWQFYLSFGEEF